MQQTEFEKGLVVIAAWRLAASSDVNELLAIACVLRNAVLVQKRFKNYGEAVEHYCSNYPLRPHPTGNEPQLVDLTDGLLTQIDGVYSNQTPDITSSLAHPTGATCFANVRRNPDFAVGRVLIGNFGTMAFFA